MLEGDCGQRAARAGGVPPRVGTGHGLLLAALALAGAAPSLAVGTAAGTVIRSAAEVTGVIGTQTVSVHSNAPSLVVDQLIDVAVGAMQATLPVQPADTSRSLAFRVVNGGNAPETLRLQLTTAVPGNGFDALAHAPALYLGTDGAATLTGNDPPYAPGGNDPVLAPGAGLLVFAVVDVPGGVADGAQGKVELAARVLQASGAPGTVVPGSGGGGGEAIIGLTGGTARADADLLVSGVDVTLLKSATVVDPDGGHVAQSGARIDYDIAVQVSGRNGVHGLVVSDAIPAATRYVPASLQLDGIALSDAADADAGAFLPTPAQIQVSLGDQPAGATHHVRFAVLIN